MPLEGPLEGPPPRGPLEDRYSLRAPEGIRLDLTLAGVGSRFIALLLDTILQLLLIGVLALATIVTAGGLRSYLLAGFAVGAFLVWFGYWIAFEVLSSGRTPGKRLTGLRVVETGGGPPGFRASAVRNLLRIIDALPGTYLVGIVVVLITRSNQRLGDLAASTLVVRERSGSGASPGGSDRPGSSAKHGEGDAPTLPPVPDWDLTRLGSGDLAALEEFLARRATLEPSARERIARNLAVALRRVVAGAGLAELAPEDLVEKVVAAKRRQRAS
ncbi:MAG: RDD family protein [Acidimicrobiales bacterium]